MSSGGLPQWLAEAWELSLNLGDAEGRKRIIGTRYHFNDTYKEIISRGVATTEEPQLTYNGIGAISRDPVDAAIADGVQRSAGGVTNRVVDRGLAIPPTIRVGAGTRISIIVTRRIGF